MKNTQRKTNASSTQNNFDALAAGTISQRDNSAHAAKVRAIFADKSYKDRYKIASFGARAFCFFASFVSVLSAGFLAGYLLFGFFSEFLGAGLSTGLAASGGVLLALCVEAIKHSFYNDFFSVYYKFGTVAKGGLLGLIFLSGLSVFSSFWGATLLPEVSAPPVKELNLLQYDKDKADVLRMITEAQKGSTYKGILTKQGHSQVSRLQIELDNISKQRADAAARYDAGIQASAGAISSASGKLGYFSLCLEFLFSLASAYFFYYQYRCYIELEQGINGVDDFLSAAPTPLSPAPLSGASNIAFVGVSGGSPAPPVNLVPRKIGFTYGTTEGTAALKPEALKPEGTEALKPEVERPAHGVGAARICPNCNKEFIKNSYQHKFCITDCKLAYHAQKHNGQIFKPLKKK